MSRLHLLQAATAADREWMAEVAIVFGEHEAGLARFQDRANGAAGTRLRDLYDTYVRTRDAYQNQE